MADTPRLDLPYLAASQAQKEVYHNISLDRLDLLVQCAVLDRNLSTPPASPADGDAYIVGPSATDAWAGHETHLALWVNSQWELIAPLPGFQCWVRDEAVQVYWSGSAWTLTGSGGGGATTLLGLSDTPDAYGGQAGKTLLVNPEETAMVFGTLAGSAPVDATYLVTSSHPILSAERVVTDNTQIAWDVGTAGQLAGTLVPHGVTLDKLAPQVPGTLLGVGADSLGPVADVQPILLGTGLEMMGSTLNATATGGGGGASTFVELTDTPDSYAGQAGKGVTVNGTASGLEFTTAVTGSYDLGLTWAGTLPASQVLLRYPFPRAVDFPAGLTGSRGVSAVAATALTTLDLRKNGTSVGSVQWAAAATTATFTMASATSFAAGDVLTVHAPGTADATLADVGLSLAGTRAVAAGEMGATTWLALTDTPDVYTGQGGNLVTVNAGATGLDYTPLTPAGRALLDDADAAAQRATLGLGTMATQNASAVAISGGTATFTGNVEIVGATTARYIVINDRAGDNAIGIQTGLNAAGGTGRYAVFFGGTAPSYFGGTVQMGGVVGINTAPNPSVQLDVKHNKDAYHGVKIGHTGSDTGPGIPMIFANAADATIGSITTNATSTAYNTSSDVRLKENIATLLGALDVIRALRPVSFRWQVDGSKGVGFLAHELMSAVPEAVSGLPDEVNDDGSIKPQQVDQSRLVPWLTAALQEAVAQLQGLTARIQTLEEALGL